LRRARPGSKLAPPIRSPHREEVHIEHRNYQLARDYFAAVTAGDLPDHLLTPDMTGWITTGGAMDKASYQRLVRLLAAMCASPLAFTIDSLTADEDRVVAEARSDGLLINGEAYANTYVFVFRIRDGRIASVAEHYNALVAQEKLVPLMKQAAAAIAD
jgi:ketosteroid isomerase-like protein